MRSKLEDLIADVDMAITISHAGYIKRTPVDVYRHQSRGGKGRRSERRRAKRISSSTCSSASLPLTAGDFAIAQFQGPGFIG